MPDEQWRPIRPYRLIIPAGYAASSDGRVQSVPRTLSDGRSAGGVLLTPRPDKDGYQRVKAGGRLIGVAALVQLAFAGPPEVRHLDGLRSNNKPENLVYGSRVENEQDKWRTEDLICRCCHRPFPAETYLGQG